MSDSRFDRDTAVVPSGGGTYDIRIDPGWWIQRGPNGGYIAAIVMRAFQAEVGDPVRHARSLTVHYLAPAVEGPARITVTTERKGRAVQFLSSRMEQDGRLIATAQAAFANAAESANGPGFADPTFPRYAPPDQVEPPPAAPVPVPMRERYDYRHVTGAPWESPRNTAETGGWIRLREPRPYDAAVVAALSDAWYPAIFTRVDQPMGVPTIDLTIHIRSVQTLQALRPDDWMAVRFRTTTATEGFLEEDGMLWAPDGTLIAHSRQLGLLLSP